MIGQVGTQVVSILEAAGTRFLEPEAPETHTLFLLHVGGASSIRDYNACQTYWRRVQFLLDTFFSAEQRALICDELLAKLSFVGRRDAYDFLAEALAERRLQEMRGALTDA